MTERPRSSLRTNLLLAAVALVFSLAIVAAAGEVAVRYRERNRETPPGTMFLWYPHIRLRQAFERNSSYYRWVTINGQGFRGSREVGPKDPETLRVIVVGESTTFDLSVDADSLTWPARLEYWLRHDLPGCNVEVVNAGVPGYRMLDNLIRLHTELINHEPDLIVLYEPHNDLFLAVRNPEPDHPDRPGEAQYTSSFSRWLTRHSLLYAKVRSRALIQRGRDAARRGEPPTWERVEQHVDRYQRELQTFLAITNDRGIPVVMVQPLHISGAGATTEPDSSVREMWESSFPLLDAERLFEVYQRFENGARETLDRAGATYIEAEGFGMRGREWFAPGDPIHFGNRGADRMGRNMATVLAGGHLPAPECTAAAPAAE